MNKPKLVQRRRVIYVIGGNFRQALSYVEEQRRLYPEIDWRPISEHQHLQGLDRPEVHTVGTLHNRTDAERIHAELKIRRATVTAK